MNLQQINIKILTTKESQINYQNFIKVFNRWIAEEDQDDYLNYADYSFTHGGPGVLLISKRANYSIDHTDLHHGFLYNRKHPVEGSTREKVRQAFIDALTIGLRLQSADELENAVRFDGGHILFIINNRHVAMNTDETFQAIQPDLQPILASMYGSGDFTLERVYQDPRKRFAIRITADSDGDLSNLLDNLSA